MNDTERTSVRSGPAWATDDSIAELIADQRRADRIRERREARERAAVDEDSATFAGIVRDLAEHGRVLRLVTPAGAISGRVAAVGRDHVSVEHGSTLTHVALRSIGAVMAADDAGAPASAPPRHRPAETVTRGFAGLLRDLVERGAQLALYVDGQSAPISGTARTCGEDVLTIAPNRPSGHPTFVQWSNVHRVDERG